MSSQKLVTRRQTDSLFDMAKSKKVACARFKTWLEKEAPAILDRLAQQSNPKMCYIGALPGRTNSIGSFSPPDFIGQGWAVWKGSPTGNGLEGESDIDARAEELTEMDLTQILFEHSLKGGESWIKGEEKLTRLKTAGGIRLSGRAFLALWLNYQLDKENSYLEWLYRNRKVTWLSFFGLILRNPGGDRYVLYLYRSSDGWGWNYDWLGSGFNATRVSAGLASPQASSPKVA